MLGISFHDAFVRTEARPEQKTMENSAQQLRNVAGSFVVALG
jgi:ATP-dependent DNA helicase RecQ